MSKKISRNAYLTGFALLLLSHSFHGQAEVVDVNGNDVLVQISNSISQIDHRLKDQRVFVSTAKFEWKEMENFRKDLMFALAHDPHGSTTKETPIELTPTFLTQKLRVSWNELEVSVLGIGELAKNEEWTTLKNEMDSFFNLRDEMLYQPARSMIKSGLLSGRLNKIQESATAIMKVPSDSKILSVKIVDPYIEKMATELSTLNYAIKQLKEFRTPRPVENPSIFQTKHQIEVLGFGGFVFLLASLMTLAGVWLAHKFKKVPVEVKPVAPVNAFNYHDWLKRLEASMQAIKNNEENMSEDFIKLKELTSALSEARKNLNQADNQQEFYESLNKLNAAAPKIEEYFDKINHKKNSEASRRLVANIVQLCEAIETKKEMSLEDAKPKLKVIKKDQGPNLKVA